MSNLALMGDRPRISPAQWEKGLSALFASIRVPNLRTVYLGGTPDFLQLPTQCLAEHVADLQACSLPVRIAVPPLNQAERAPALSAGVDYIDPIPWFCSNVCSPVIGDHEVYLDHIHITATWALYLRLVLANAVGIPMPHK